MADSSDSCNLTPVEMQELDGWSFVKSFREGRNHRDLLNLAGPLYTSLCRAAPSNQPPTQGEFCKAYASYLILSDLYLKRIAGRKLYLPLSLYDYFAKLLAKYVVNQDWNIISSAPCP